MLKKKPSKKDVSKTRFQNQGHIIKKKVNSELPDGLVSRDSEKTGQSNILEPSIEYKSVEQIKQRNLGDIQVSLPEKKLK